MPHDAWTGANNTLHLLQPAVDADFDLEVKIDGPMTAEFQLSGILVKQDEQNYLRFDFNSDGLNTRIFAATILNNLATGITGFNDVVAPNGAVPLYMRVSRERNLFRLFYSLDGTTWSQETEFTADIVVSAVGIFAGSSGSTPPAHTALFDYFHASLPAAPQALRPANGAGDQATDLTLAWKRYAPGTTYHLQLSADSTFAGTMVINDSTLTDTTQAVSGLQLGLPYYWRLRGKLGSVATGFSSRWQFTTVVGPPSSPALLAPANGVTGVGVPTKLSWHKASFASSYRLEVGTDSTFAGGVVYLDSTLTDTSRTVAGLQYATRYFWRVKAKGAGGESGYSETWRFTSILAPPGIPLLRTPADGAGNLPATIVLAWSPVATATQYHVQVGTSAGFALPLAVNDSTVTDTTRSVSGLLPAVTYYWRVRAKGPGGAGAYAGARSFSTQPGAPGLIAPANLSTAEPLAVTFRWHPAPGATGYRLQVATDSLFATGIIKNDTTITDTFKLVAGLTINTRYYWRVSARDAEGYGPFSAGWSFLTFTPLPNQVTLLLPAEGVQIAADTARLVWSRSQPLVQRYWMEIAGDSLFQFKSVDSMLTDTSTVRRQLVRNQSYFWRVRAQNPGGWGPFSAVYGFRTLVTGVTDRKGLPTIYALDQNYPNPFNPATVIEFAVPREGRVRLEVYNLLGQHVGTLLDEVRQAGYHSLTFDAHGLPSGVYLYRLTADGVSLLKKMMLVR
jgi:regulation of enolase protein 1 (concanavalin A-like superfamily)